MSSITIKLTKIAFDEVAANNTCSWDLRDSDNNHWYKAIEDGPRGNYYHISAELEQLHWDLYHSMDIYPEMVHEETMTISTHNHIKRVYAQLCRLKDNSSSKD